jgi:hypothetical protein
MVFDLVAAVVAAALLVLLTVGVRWYVGGFGGNDRSLKHPGMFEPPTPTKKL